MLTSAVADRTVTRLRAPVIENRYGDDERDWTAPASAEIAGCALQPATSTETLDPTRQTVITRWQLFAPPGTDLAAFDRIDVDGVVYEVDGDPADWSAPGGRADHVAATLQRVEG